MADDPIMDALMRWEELRDQGQALTAEELCPDEPALWLTLQERIDRRQRLRPFLEPPTLPSRPGAVAGFPVIPGYEFLEVIGQGGMGIVYKARQTKLDRLVALKMILWPQLDELARFCTEAEAVARLEHPNIVRIHEVAEHAGRPYLVLEWAAGGNLARHLNDQPLSAQVAAELLRVLAHAVAHAHSRGIVHRDLKPANILLAPAFGGGEFQKPPPKAGANFIPKIADFGLAKRLDANQSHTQIGTVLGTPNYMAPEQASGRTKEVGPATDIYALGAILYELVTGRPPFQGDSALDTLEQVRSDEPLPPRRLRPRLPRDLETICLKCLQKEPAKRYAGAGDLAEDLRRFLAGEPIRARPVSWWERSVKWARRRPAVAALLTAVVLITAIGLAGVTWAWRRAETALVNEQQALRAEGQERIRAETNLYFQSIALAQRNWQDADVAVAEQILDQCSVNLRHWEWRYLKRLCHPELLTLGGHNNNVSCVAWSPDGSRLASASGAWGEAEPSGEVKIWDAATGRELAVCHGHSQGVLGIAFSPDGKRIASAGWDSKVRIWDAATGQEIPTLTGHKGVVYAVAWSPDGRYVASSSSDRTVILWDAVTGQRAHSFTGPKEDVFCVAFSPDGRFLGSAGHEGVVWVWDVASKKEQHRIPRENDIRALAFSPDSQWLATGGYDGAVTIWELTRGARHVVYTNHSSYITAVAFSPDGQYVASADASGGVKIWDPHSTHTLSVVRQHTGAITSLAFHPAGRHLASGAIDQVVKISDFTKEPAYRCLRVNYTMTSSLSFHPNGRLLAMPFGPGSNERARMIAVWDLESDGPPRFLAKQLIGFTAVCFQPNGEGLALASKDGMIKLWHLSEDREIRRFPGHVGRVNALAFRPDGHQFASAGNDGAARIWATATGQKLHSLEGHVGDIQCVAYHPDGEYLATGGKDGTVRLWNADTGAAIGVLTGHAGAVDVVAVSPDGQVLASAGEDQVIRIWNLTTILLDRSQAVPERILPGHARPVTGMAFTSDGRRLASSSLDQTVKLWDVATGNEALALRAPLDNWNGVAISPDDRYLVAGTTHPHVWEAGVFPTTEERKRAAPVEWPTQAWYRLQAEKAEDAHHWFGAAFYLSRLMDKEPSPTALLARRGKAYAESGQWVKASDDFARMVALEPENHSSQYSHAITLLGAGDKAGYRRLMAQMRDKFATTSDASIASALLYASLPVANTFPDRASLLRLGKLAAGTFPGNARVHGAALCRAGKYEEAVSRFSEAGGAGWKFRAWDYLFLAMAHHGLGGLGHASQARDCLEEAVRWILDANEKETDGSPRQWFNWSERVEVGHLRRETESLLAGK